jgi:phage-related protein
MYPLKVFFYRTDRGNEPVREWLKGLSAPDKRIIGEDIKIVQYGWPIGMPVVRKVSRDLWEVRTRLNSRVARVLFTLDENNIVLLHGYIKKTNAIPKDDLELAVKRMKQVRSYYEADK